MELDPLVENKATAKAIAKETGAYFTPDSVVRSLISWAVRSPNERMIDPSCGDGRFLAAHAKSVGIEQDPSSSAIAMQRAPAALVHEGDFFAWAMSTKERFDCAAGNPPFIRYQLFKGDARKRALSLCSMLGANFTALSSSWPLFLVGTASLLKPGGRMAFVVPAEIGHAPYSAPLIDYLANNFGHLQIVAVREKLFPSLSEDCWLLYANRYGGQTDSIALSIRERFTFAKHPPKPTHHVPLSSWDSIWNRRLRPFLMPTAARNLYERLAFEEGTTRFGSIAHVNIGYVSGANDFFHLRPSDAEQWGIPEQFLQPTVRNTRSLPATAVNAAVVKRWIREDQQSFLLRLRKDEEVHPAVQKYLRTETAKQVATGYKCRTRDPWYVVPDVKIPDFFMSYMSGRKVALVKNVARCACTNSLHTVRLKDRHHLTTLQAIQSSPLFQLSCEIEGHPLGGGMLKLEPREATNILIPSPDTLASLDPVLMTEALTALQSWRHYEAA